MLIGRKGGTFFYRLPFCACLRRWTRVTPSHRAAGGSAAILRNVNR